MRSPGRGCPADRLLAVDRSAIFHEITKRNALRKAAQMPLLDVRREFDRLVALKALEEYYELREARYADDQKRILETVVAEYRKDDPNWGRSGLGVLAIRLEAERRFQRLLEQHGVTMPYVESMCVYGSDKKA